MTENWIIDNVDMKETAAERYWSFPKTYKGNPREETKSFILSGAYLGAIKKDGHYCRLIKSMDGQIRMQGRTKSVNGEYLDKHEWVPQLNDFFNSLPNGTCLLGELYFPNQPGSRKVTTILGCLKDKAIDRQNKGERLHYYIFDVWAWGGKSLLKTSMENRIKYLNKIAAADYVDIATYYDGEELWNQLCKALESGEEGMVITKRMSVPEPGKRTARKTLKVKQELAQTIDAFIDGAYKSPTMEYTGKELKTWPYYINAKSSELLPTGSHYDEYIAGAPIIPVTKNFYYNRAGALSFSVMKDGKPKHIGYISGLTEEVREGIVKEPEKWVGKVVEISAMQIEHIDGEYSLRHGKVVCFRPDKTPNDCEWSQIVSE